MNGAVVLLQSLEHPCPAELHRRGPMGVVEGEPAGAEIGAQEQQSGLDPQHVQRAHPVRQHAVAFGRVPDGVPDGDRVRRVDPDLVSEVAGVARAAHGHGPPADRARRDAEERQLTDRWHQARQQVARARSLHSQRPDVQADLLDRHRQPAHPVGEPGEIRLRRRQQEFVRCAVLDDAVLEHEPAFVEPGRVVGVPGRTTADVARQHAREEPLRVPPRDAVLVQRRGVEDADAVPDREVLELVRRLVARHDHVPGPVLPQAGVVQRAGPLVERRGADHRARAYRLARTRAGPDPGSPATDRGRSRGPAGRPRRSR